MAENPVRRLGRLLGGVVLMQGGLGHQVLGQLLVADTGDAVLAGAMMVIAGTSRQRNIVAQAALRTAAPTLAALWFLRSKELDIQRREAGLTALELKRHKIEIVKAVIQQRAGRRVATAASGIAIVVLTPPAPGVESPEVAVLRKDNQRLLARCQRLSVKRRKPAALPLIPSAAIAPTRRPALTIASPAPLTKAIKRRSSKPAPRKTLTRRVKTTTTKAKKRKKKKKKGKKERTTSKKRRRKKR